MFKLFKEYLSQEEKVQLLIEQQNSFFSAYESIGKKYLELILNQKISIQKLYENLTDNWYKELLIRSLERTEYEELYAGLRMDLIKRLPLTYKKKWFPIYVD